jgi:hypothetical protein
LAEFKNSKEKLMSAMNERGVKPVEGNKAWEPFWAFMRAIDRGDSTVRKSKKAAQPRGIIRRLCLF